MKPLTLNLKARKLPHLNEWRIMDEVREKSGRPPWIIYSNVGQLLFPIAGSLLFDEQKHQISITLSNSMMDNAKMKLTLIRYEPEDNKPKDAGVFLAEWLSPSNRPAWTAKIQEVWICVLFLERNGFVEAGFDREKYLWATYHREDQS